jgi:hypothetical protein
MTLFEWLGLVKPTFAMRSLLLLRQSSNLIVESETRISLSVYR